jgi:hypothetical protein
MTYDGSSINQATFGTGFGFKQNVSSDVILTFARLYRGNPPNISNAYSSVTYTQPSSSVFPPIYITSSTGAKIGGVNSDPFASWLVLAIPGNVLLDVSNSINSSSTTKGVYAFGSGVVTSITQSKFYGSSIYIPGWVASANTGIKVTGMPTGFLYGDWTAEGWFYLTTLSRATLFKLGVCTNPSSVSNTTTNPTIRLLIESATTSWIEITAGAYYQASFSSSVFAINQWFHVALVRSASPGNKGIFTVFVNGTARTLTQNLATGTRPVGDPGTIMFVGTHDDTNTNDCNIKGYVQDVRFYVTSKYTSNFSVSATPISKTATLVSSTSTSLRLEITPDYYDTITFSASLKGPGSTTGIATTTTSLTDIVPAPADVQSSTISARYLRLTLFYAGGTGTSGPSFPKLGIYTQSADAYEDTGISSLNIARSATFISVSGDSAAATTTSMLSCINDTRTSWSASTSGTTFGTTKTTGPAYYTIDLGSIQTIAALKFAEVTYESTGWQWFSAKIEFSTDNVSWNLAHLVNATGNETQPYLHSGYSLNSVTFPATVTSIYTTNTTGVTKTGGYNVDAYSSNLVFAFPGDSTSDVSNFINSSSTNKAITFTTGYVTSSNPKFYGNSYSLRTPTGGGAFVVNGLPSNMFNSNFTLEVWLRPTIPSNPVDTGNTVLEIGGYGVTSEMFIGFDTGAYSAGSTLGRFYIYRRGGTPDTYYTSKIYSVNTWHHFALVRDGANFVLYINGAAAVTFPSWTLPTVTKFCMGGINFTNYEYQDFYGQIQDLRLYTATKYTSGFSIDTVTSLIGESLVLSVVSRQYKPTSYSFPTSLGAVTGTLSEGISGKLSIVASTTQGATAILAHSSAAPDANGGFTLWESQATIVTSGLSLLLDAGNTESYPGTGTTWTDISGNGRTGTLTNGPTYSSSNGGYIVFDGSNDTVTGTIPASVFSGAHTVSAWVYRRSVGPWSTVFASGGNSCTIVRFMTNGTSTIVGANNAGLVATASGVEIGADHVNQWLHVTMVYEGTANGSAVTVYVYKNGTLIKSNGQTLYWTLSNTGSYNVGYHSSGGSSQWDGYISQVGVYNRALSAAEIDQNYHALKGRYGITGIGGGTSVIGTGTFDSGTLTTIVKPILSGQVYFYVKSTAPGGGSTSSSYVVVGPVTVEPYPLPTSVTVGTCVLKTSVASGTCTLVLSGPNTANLVASKITVTVGSVAATVSSYTAGTATISFTVTPTTVGTTTITVVIIAPLTGATTSTTLTTTTVIQGPAASVSVTSGALVYNTSQTLGITFRDAASNIAYLAGTLNTDAIAYAKVTHATAPFWVTDLTGATRSTTSPLAWQDELGTSLVLALPLDAGTTLDQRSVAGGLAGQATVIAIGTSSWIGPTPPVKFYGSSTSFSGSGYLSVSALPTTLGSGDFTVELWANATTISGCLFEMPSIKLELFGTTARVSINNGSWVPQITASVSVSAVTWMHYAVVRYGNTTTLYINGIPRGNTTQKVTTSFTTMTIGQYFTGYLTDVRVYVTAKYMSTFSMWTSTLGTVTTGISLLLDAGNTTSYPGTGTIWTDLSGNGYNGTLTNGPTYSSSNGGYIVFDGSNDIVTGSIATSLFSSAHTITCWFYRRSITDWSGLFTNNTTVYGSTILGFISSSNMLGINQAGSSATAISVDLGSDHLNKWIYGAIVIAGASNGSAVNVYAYKDGNLITSTGSLYWNLSQSPTYSIGLHYASSHYFNGYIPYVAVYNRTLSAAEIAQNYNALKGRYGFTGDTGVSNFIDIPVSSITRTGSLLSVPITATSYRSARLFLSVKGAGTSGTNLELATIARPTQYISPTSFTYTITGTINVTVPKSVSITMTGADTTAGTVAVYASTSQTDLEPIIVCTSAPLSTSGLATAQCTFSIAGTLYISIRAISPEGVLGSLVVSSVPLTVIAYSLPTNVSETSLLETTTLSVGASTGSLTAKITGSNTSNVTSTNIAVFMNTSSTQISNGTVTAYNSSTGIVTFTVTPTVTGMNTLYVKITAPVVGSTQSTTLAFTGTTGQGYFVDAAIPFPPLKLPVAGSATQAGTSSVILSDGSWSYVGGYLGVIVGRVFTGDFTLVVSWTTIDSSAAYFYVTAAMLSKTVASTSDFIWNNQETWSPSTYSSNFPGYSLLFSWYNSSYGGGSNRFIANWYKTFYRYQRIGNSVSLDFGASATGPWTSIVTGTTTTGSQVMCFIGTCSAENSQKTAKIESLVTSTETFGSSSYVLPISFTFTPIAGYVDGASSNMTIATLGGSTASSPITVYYSSIPNATSVSSLTQAGTGTLASNTSTVSVAIPSGNWYVYIRITSPNSAVGPVILSSFTTSVTATFYYPFVSDIKNYTTGVGVSDAVMGVAGNLSGGTAIFSEKSLVLTGSPTRNAAGASYVVLPSTSSGNTAAFSCWFKSNNNGNFTRIIDMASNGSFRLYITGTNTLNFNDVYTISTTTNINNNTWNFIAINATGNNFSWVINSGDAGNSGSGSISSKPVNFTASIGYLGHSFGGDPEFAGSLKEVRFFANANLTSEQISTMYAGTTLLTSRQYTQATSIVSFTPAIPVQSATTTFAVTLGGYETVVNGTSSLYYSAIDSDTNPTLIGTAALLSGVVTVSGSVPLNTFYLYARSISPTSVQGSLLVSSLVTPRAYSFPTSITFTSIQVNVNTQLTFAPADGLASANVIIYYHATNTSTNPTECGTGTISSSGIANITCSFPSGSAVYVYARVTSPAGAQGSLLISSITGIAAPVITITSSSGEIATRTFNGATYTCIRSSGTLTVHKAITGAEIFIIAGGGGGSFSAGGGGGAGGAAYISNASIPAGTYAVTVGTGGAGSSFDGGNGTNGTNSVGFGITVYGGGGGHHTSTGNTGGCGGGGGYGQNSVGGGVTTATGSLSGITGNLFTYGNAGGGNPTPNSYVGGTGAGGGIGGVGGSATTTPTGGTGGVGRSIWSDWCAACGVGEGDTSGVFWIGGGGGGTSNETSGVRRAGDGGKGGGGKGGFATSMTVLGFDGCATSGIDYSGGGGGGGHITLTASLAQGYVPPGGRGGSGVIMIKQATTGVYTTINAPTDIAGLQVWLDGSDPNNGTLPVNGSTIGTWVDKVTGNLRSATPVNSAKKAIYRSAGTVGGIKNTLGTMYFNNTPYKIPYTGISPTYTIFSVFRAERGLLTSGLSMTPVTTNSSCYILSGGQECCLYFGMMYDQFLTAVGVPPSTWYGMAVNTPATFIRSQWVIATMQYSAATKTTTTFLNGITMTPKGPDATAQNNGNAWNDFFIGQSATSADYRLQGYIGEILIYNSVLSTVDRKKVESYLSLKYGLGVAITRVYTFPTSITFTSLQTSASSTTLSFSPADGFDSASVIIYYHATNSSTSPTQCGTGTISSSGSATITCTLPENQVVYIYAKVTSPTGVEGSLICSALSGTVKK